MKVLLAGANGQLGRALMAQAPDSYPTLALGRDAMDISDQGAVRRIIFAERPDILINAAAYTAVDLAEDDVELAKAVNSDAVQAMVDALDACGGRLVHVSTDFVFDGTAGLAYRPGEDRNPLSTYGKTKALGEEHLRDCDLLVRTSWLYAAGARNFVTTMLKLMRERDEIGVVADQIGCPTWVNSLASTIWALISKGSSGSFHYSDAGVASWYDFAVAIAEEAVAVGLLDRIPLIRPLSTAEYPTPAERPQFSLLDSSATHAAVGSGATHWRVNLRLMLKEELALG